MKRYILSVAAFAFLFLLFYCRQKTEVIPTSNSSAPLNLLYQPKSLTLEYNTVGDTSVVPFIQGTLPITFSVKSIPNSFGNITIRPNGSLVFKNGLDSGSYKITVLASNNKGTTVFPNCFTVLVKSFLPTELKYQNNSIGIVAGTTGSSGLPSLSHGSTSINYSLSSSPAAPGEINIDPSSGVITTTSSLAIGTYTISVTATNAVGTVVFNNAFTIDVTSTAEAPNNLLYATNNLSLLQTESGNSEAPSIKGTSPISYSMTSSPINNAISINSSSGIISIAPGNSFGLYSIAVSASNGVGTTVFTNAFSVTIEQAVFFNSHIKPIMVAKCVSCHDGNSLTDYSIYLNAANNINSIIDRTNRTPGSAGFMPNYGTKLSNAQLELLQKWKDQGLKP